MKLPSIRVSLPLLFLLWCVCGVWLLGWVVLAYPAMWAAVALVFLGVGMVLRNKTSDVGAESEPTPPV